MEHFEMTNDIATALSGCRKRIITFNQRVNLWLQHLGENIS